MRNSKDTFTLSDGSTVTDLTNWIAFDALTDDQVVAAAKSDPDAQPATDADLEKYQRLSENRNFPDRAREVSKAHKIALNIRYDADIVNFFKQQGRGYQRLMNTVLRAYVESQQAMGHESRHG